MFIRFIELFLPKHWVVRDKLERIEFFLPWSWMMRRSKSGRVKLLLTEYRLIGDGWIKLLSTNDGLVRNKSTRIELLLSRHWSLMLVLMSLLGFIRMKLFSTQEWLAILKHWINYRIKALIFKFYFDLLGFSFKLIFIM